MVKVFYLDFFSRKSEIKIACVHGGKQYLNKKSGGYHSIYDVGFRK